MKDIKRICIFCGSSLGDDPLYDAEARAFGKLLASKNIGVVYGGGNAGLMGSIAESVLEAGGEIIGVIPTKLMAREHANLQLTELYEVETMHARKALMEKLSDAIVALPGGIGTLDEFCEIMTWNQLGFINKPTGILNLNGYFDEFLGMLRTFVRKGFFQGEEFDRLLVENTGEALLERMGIV